MSENKLYMAMYELVEKTLLCTKKILDLSKDPEQVDKTIASLHNRERLINAINELQAKLNSMENKSNTLNHWNKEISNIIVSIQNMDIEIINNLEATKRQLNNEIAKTFKNKENFKGYNLNDIK